MSSKKLFGMSAADKARLLSAMRRSQGSEATSAAEQGRTARMPIAPEWLRFDSLPGYTEIRVQQAVAKQAGLEDIFYVCHDGLGTARTSIHGREYLNFFHFEIVFCRSL